MAVTINARGTSVPYFKIGKSGTTFYQGDSDPSGSYTINANDVWFDTSNNTIKFRVSNAWSGITTASDLTVTGDLTVQGTTTTVNSTEIQVQNTLKFEGATSNDYETTLTVVDPTADRTVTIPNATDTLVGKATTDTLTNKSIDLDSNTLSGTLTEFNTAMQGDDFVSLTGTETLTNKTLTAPNLNAPVFGTGTSSPYFTEVRYNTSNMMKFNQMYTGASSGSYFDPNEYQKVVTIIPAGNSENYQIIGRITAQNAGETHIVNFNAALRSGDPLPDLSWTVEYSEEYNGARYIDPQLWTKETTTSGFIFAFKVLSRIYGTVTVDMDVIPRTSSLLSNVSVNSTQNSEQSSVDTGYTANDMTRVFRRQGTTHTFSGNILPDTTETYDIGSSTMRFNDIYLAGSTVDIGGTKLSKDSDGNLDIKDSSDVRKTIKAAAIELFDTDGKKIKIERDSTSGKMKSRKYDSSGNEETDSDDVITLEEDKSPKLGGDFDVNGNKITSTLNGDIEIAPHGSGNVNIISTGAIVMPVGTTAQRPGTAVVGMMRFNSDIDSFEGYNGASWVELGHTTPTGDSHDFGAISETSDVASINYGAITDTDTDNYTYDRGLITDTDIVS